MECILFYLLLSSTTLIIRCHLVFASGSNLNTLPFFLQTLTRQGSVSWVLSLKCMALSWQPCISLHSDERDDTLRGAFVVSYLHTQRTFRPPLSLHRIALLYSNIVHYTLKHHCWYLCLPFLTLFMPYLVTLEGMQQQCRDGRARSQSCGTVREPDVSRSIWTRPSHLTPHPASGQFSHPFSVKMAIPVFDRRRKIINPLSGLILKASPSYWTPIRKYLESKAKGTLKFTPSPRQIYSGTLCFMFLKRRATSSSVFHMASDTQT
jgi:hypothetical protein